MIKFFGGQKNEDSTSSDSRLRSLEWKVNLLLGIVGLHFLLSVFMLASDFLLPSKTTIVIVVVVLGVVGWFLRNQILGLIKRAVAKQIVGEENLPKKKSSRDMASREEQIL